MKPIKLTMSAFGPYGGSETVEFDKLYDNGLFLITGPTGAGKTTVFDGMTYALYGEVNLGDRDKLSGIRSQFAKENILTSVELEFEIRGEAYKIIRTPRQLVPKKRGSGLKEEGPKVELHIPGGVILTKGDEVNGKGEHRGKIREILGIDIDQFKKIIMIPQGDFRQFLYSNSKDKKEILRKIFGTEIYEKMAEKIKSECDELEKNIKTSEYELEKIKFQLDLGDDEIWEKMKVTSDYKKIFSYLELIISDLEREILEKQKQIEIMDKDKDSLVTERAVAEKVNESFDILHKNRETEKKLTERSEEIDLLRDKHERYKRALKLTESYTVLTGMRATVKDGKLEIEKLEEELKELSESNKDELKNYDSIRETAESKKIIYEKLKSYKDSVKDYKEGFEKFQEVQSNVENIKKLYFENNGKISEKNEIIEDYTNRLKGLEEKLDERRKFILKKTEMVSWENILEGIEELHAESEKEGVKVEKKYKEKIKTDEELEIAKGEYENADALLNNSLAVKIGAKLIEGKPCPVCGSLNHPDPVKAMDGEITPEEVSLKMDKYQSLMKKSSEIKAKLDEMADRKIKLEEKIKEKCTENNVSHWEKELTGTRAELGSIEGVLEKLPVQKDIDQLVAKKGKFDEEMKFLESTGKGLKEKLESAEKEMNILSGGVLILKKDLDSKGILPEAYEKTLKEAQEELLKSEKRLNKIEEISEKIKIKTKESELKNNDLMENRKKASVLESDFQKGLKNEGFAEEENYLEAKKEDSEGLQKEIEGYDTELRDVKRDIIRLEKEVEGKQKTDLNNYDEKISEFKEKMTEADAEKNRLAGKSKELAGAIKIMDRENKTTRETRKKYTVIKKLSLLANGRTDTMINFETYVLSSYFTRVLEEANVRLKTMSGGRYSLHLREEAKNRVSAGGLDIMIYDTHTGRKRDVKTLSGGETFKASLSLALGLSDVVQQEAGGIQLDSIFIDEGFGTLDDESLDRAMDTLIELQSSGRLVGIISHVNSLKERISSQINIVKESAGSKIKVSL